MINLDSNSDSSDLEVIEIGAKNANSKRGQSVNPIHPITVESDIESDDDDDEDIDFNKEELLDIDDDDYSVPAKKRKETLRSSPSKPGPSSSTASRSRNSSISRSRDRSTDEIMDDIFEEDLKRAIRLSLSEQKGHSSKKVDYDYDDLGGFSDDSDIIPIEEKKTDNQPKRLPSATSTSSMASPPSRSRNRSFEDAGSQEIDDIFQELEYGSLADYLADKEKQKSSEATKTVGVQKVAQSSYSSSSSSLTEPPWKPQNGAGSLNSASSLPPSSSASSSSVVNGSKPKSAKAKPSPKLKLKLPSQLKSGTFELRSQSPESPEKRKAIFSRVDPISLGSPEGSPISYRIDPKQFRKAKNQDKAQPKKVKKATGKQGSQSSSSNSQFSAGLGSEENSQNPPSSVASSSSSVKQKASDMKSIVLKIHGDICSDEFACRLTEKELRFEPVESMPVDGLILFERHIFVTAYDKLGQCTTKDIMEPDQHAMIIFPIEKHLDLIQNEVEVINNDSNFSATSHSQCLTEWVKNVKKKLSGKKITLLIQGQDAYVRKVRKNLDKEYRNRILNADEGENAKKKRPGRSKVTIQLTKTEIQSALIHVQLHSQINYRLYEKPAELSEMLYHYTKSIAEAPAKIDKMNQPGLDWHAVSDSVGGIPVEEDGRGMKSLWIHQLSQFPGVGQDMATAIARVHKNPKELFKAYRRCGSADEGKNMLTEIPVTIGVGPLKKTRRLGPEASKKIYRFFTSTDGERELNV